MVSRISTPPLLPPPITNHQPPTTNHQPPTTAHQVSAMRSIEQHDGGTSVVTTTMKEEQRLAAVVGIIDDECAIVPRGAYNKLPDGTIAPVSTWTGLSFEDAGKLSSYNHFRVPTRQIPPIERAKMNKTLDFWDPLTDDVPRGCWTLTNEAAAQSVLLKSWLWPGFVFYHRPNTSAYAGVYNGTGLRNSDIVFML
jgi:radial spoke head protein 9